MLDPFNAPINGRKQHRSLLQNSPSEIHRRSQRAPRAPRTCVRSAHVTKVQPIQIDQGHRAEDKGIQKSDVSLDPDHISARHQLPHWSSLHALPLDFPSTSLIGSQSLPKRKPHETMDLMGFASTREREWVSPWKAIGERPSAQNLRLSPYSTHPNPSDHWPLPKNNNK